MRGRGRGRKNEGLQGRAVLNGQRRSFVLLCPRPPEVSGAIAFCVQSNDYGQISGHYDASGASDSYVHLVVGISEGKKLASF